jgi:RNA polymerase sigma-70 factor (ECF subfamily)
LNTTEHETRFRRWLDEHMGLIFKVVRSFADGASDADDLLQEILLQVWLSLPSFRAESKETTWLYRVALNTALAWKRRESGFHSRRRPLELVADSLAPSESGSMSEALAQLYEAIRALPPADRALMLLHFDGLSYNEMAEVIGISESNVGVRLNRIKRKLAEQLKVPSYEV